MKTFNKNYCHVTHQIDAYDAQLTREQYFDIIADQFDTVEEFEFELERIEQNRLDHIDDFYFSKD